MKKVIKIIENGVVKIRGEIEIPSKDHLEAQIKYPARVFDLKVKKIERKRKYKIDYRNDYDDQF